MTTGQLYMLLQSLNTKMALNNVQQKQLTDKVDRLEMETKDIRAAWKSAGALVTFVKYVGGFLVACGVVYAAAKGAITFWREMQ